MFCVLAWKSFQRNKNFWSLKDARGFFCSYQGMSFSPLTLFQSLIFPFPLCRIYHENNFDCVCKFWNCNHSPRSFVFLIDFFFSSISSHIKTAFGLQNIVISLSTFIYLFSEFPYVSNVQWITYNLSVSLAESLEVLLFGSLVILLNMCQFYSFSVTYKIN